MFNYKKVSAVLSSVLMIGMTAGVATAANYPAPFVVGSTANVGIVYGSGSPSAVDLVPATNIETNLNSKITGTTSSGSTATGGDSALIAKSSDNLNLGNTWSVYTGTMDEDDLSTLLASGTYTASDNDESKYEQTITLGEPNLTQFRDSDYESLAGLTTRTPVIGFQISSDTFVMNYTLDFTTEPESDIDSNSRAEDIEGSYLPLFGKEYFVSRLDNRTNSDDFWGTLRLLDSANMHTLNEGESVTVDGKSIGIQFISSTEVRFTVDGETVPSNNKLGAGDSVKLSDGSYLGVTSIDKLEVSGSTGSVTFSIGSGKLEITSGSKVKLNDVNENDITGYVYYGTGSSGTETIDKIVLEWKAYEEMFLTPGSELTMPGFEKVKFSMGDLVRNTEEKVIVEKEDDTNIRLTVPIKDGTVSFPILHESSTSGFDLIGKAGDERLATSGNTTLTYYDKNNSADFDKYFVASYNVSSEAESYLLRARVEVSSDGIRNQTDISKYDGSSWTEVCPDRYAGKTCSLGSVSFTIDEVYYSSAKRYVSMTAGTDVNFNTIYTSGGLRIYLPYMATSTLNTATAGLGSINVSGVNPLTATMNESHPGSGNATYYLYMDGENKDDTIVGGTEFYLTIDRTSSGNLQVSQVQGAGSGGGSTIAEELGSSTGIYQAYIVDDVAPRILHYTKPDEDYAEVYYPTGSSETYAEVYIAEEGVTVTSEGGTALGEVIYKDSEVSSTSAKNLIVVGGSCVNSVAASLVGGAHCTTAWEDETGVGAGKYLIQSYNNPYSSGKIALLVAGYEAVDTANAQKALINTANTIDTTVGKKYTGTTETDIALV